MSKEDVPLYPVVDIVPLPYSFKVSDSLKSIMRAETLSYVAIWKEIDEFISKLGKVEIGKNPMNVDLEQPIK